MTLLRSTLLLAALGLAACGSTDAPTACTDMCTASGFSSGRSDVQSNETNCFCSGGSGAVTATRCTDMCTSLGKASGATFKSANGPIDSCQCQ